MTTLWQRALAVSSPDAGGYAFRQYMGALPARDWTGLSIRLNGHPTLPLTLANMALGTYLPGSFIDYEPPIKLTVGGNETFTFTPGDAPVWTDPITSTSTIQSGDALLFHAEVPAGSFGSKQLVTSSTPGAGYAYKVGAYNSWNDTSVTGWSWQPYRALIADRLIANAAAGSGGFELIDSFRVTSQVSNIKLINNKTYDFKTSMLVIRNVATARELIPAKDSVLVAYCGFDRGELFNKSNHVSTGLRVWPNASAAWPPTATEGGNKIDPLSTANNGFLLTADSGDSPWNGSSGTFWFTSAGTLANGVQTNTTYRGIAHKNALGLINNVELPIGHWDYGTCGNGRGQALNALLIEASGNSQTWPIVQGEVEWWGLR